MRMLHGIERRLQGAVDKTFARIFGGSVQPGEVTAALQQEAAANLQHHRGRAIAPNKYIVQLGPSDHADVGDDVRRVSAAFTGMLADYVADQGWDTFADVDVRLEESDQLRTGQFRITSLVDPDVAPRVAATPAGLMDRFFEPAGEDDEDPGVARQAGGPWGGVDHPAPPNPAFATPFATPPGPYAPPAPYQSSPYQPAPHPPTPYAQAPYQQAPYQPAPYQPSPQPQLLVEDGSERRYALRRGSNVVGRGQDAALRLADTSVSRRHIDVYFDGQVAIVHDLGSTNGTTVNGAPVQTWQLADGDVIRIGQSTVVFALR